MLKKKINIKSQCFRGKLQRGASLIESLVAVTIMALGVLGVLGMQMRTLADTQTGVRRAQAIRLIEDLSERIKSQPNGIGSMPSYARSWDAKTETSTDVDCSSTYCDPAAFAEYDLNRWIDNVRASLPLGDASIFLAKNSSETDPRQLGVMVSWRENEKSTETSDIFKNGVDETGAEVAVSCPEKRICHTQYISPGQRCRPDVRAESGFFCSIN